MAYPKNDRDNDDSFLSDCSDTCRSIPHPRAQHAADVLDVLDDDDASNVEKSVAVLSIFF
jgi:hypothetical protein